jgi:hypothetical protein
MNTRTVTLALALVALAGCNTRLHLTYDFGRAYTEAFVAQADLTRASVQAVSYSLYGVEAAQIRIRVQENSTDVEDTVVSGGGSQ